MAKKRSVSSGKSTRRFILSANIMANSPRRTEPQHYQVEDKTRMDGSGVQKGWDSSLNRFAPFVANLLFGKCKPIEYDHTDESDGDTACALISDDDDLYVFDDEEDEIDCPQKQVEEKSAESPSSCDVRTGSLTSDATDDSSDTISSCAEKERQGLQQTPSGVSTHSSLMEFALDDERGQVESEPQSKEGPEENEPQSHDPLEPQIARCEQSEVDGIIPLEWCRVASEHSSVLNLSEKTRLEESKEEAGDGLSEQSESIEEISKQEEEMNDDCDGNVSLKNIGVSPALELLEESNAITQPECEEGNPPEALDSQPEGVGETLDSQPEGVGGTLDYQPEGVGGALDSQPEGVGEALGSQPEGVGISGEGTREEERKAEEGEDDGKDKAKVRFKARVIFPADFKLGGSFGGSLIRRESCSSKLSGSNACNLSIPKSVNSRASSIVSASRSVRSLPRETELFDIDEEDNKELCCTMRSPRTTRRKRSTNGSESDVHQVSCVAITDAHERQGIYAGAFAKSLGVPHGFGRFEFDSGKQWFEGDFKHGEWLGHGRQSDSNGDFYKGSFFCGLKHGAGVMKFADGRTFEGQFMQDQMAQGLMTYQDGSTYNGGWVDGLRHGHGHSIFQDNSVYVGAFREGEFSGFGKMLWMDGGYYEGEWERGEMQGYGKEILPNGNLKHEGQWRRGQPVRNGPLGVV